MPLVKKLTKIGNSYGVILPADILDLLGIKPEDELEMTVEKEGLLIHPSRKENNLVMQAFTKFVDQYDETLKKLAQ
ncbi:MAG: AbrB/MazE/SpoVT family DNA-binding domain-containing protein [Deltaproteobacteria bacterium]|nr:AbrB/MazE/SpoVT family DNA-binding domain-containing protein [Deltaproteobacteria bacterium]